MAFIIDILKHASVSALGNNPIVSSPVWFYVLCTSEVSLPRHLKYKSFGDLKNQPQFTQRRIPSMSSPINKHSLSTYNIIKNSTSNQNQVKKNATKTKFMPIKCIENGCWLSIAIEYGFIYSEEKRTQISPPNLDKNNWDKNKIQRNPNTLHRTSWEQFAQFASLICPLTWVSQSVLGVVQVLFCQPG